MSCLLLLLYLKLKDVEHFYNSDRIWHALHNIDYKFLLIPIAFILLRIWSLVVDVTLIYVGVPVEQIPKTVAIIFVYLSVSCVRRDAYCKP